MGDPRVANLAKILVDYSVKVTPGEKVLILASVLGRPLVAETYRAVIHAGGHPLLLLQEDIYTEIQMAEANEDQLRYLHDPVRQVYETYDCFINIRGHSNTRSLTSVDPARLRLVQEARKEMMSHYMQRAAEGLARWVVTMYPTNADAQEADMSLTEFEDFVYGACFADSEDAVGSWHAFSREQQGLLQRFVGKDRVELKGPDIDLSLSIKGRQVLSADGATNMPDGELFTGPVEESVNGWVRFTYPAIWSGREVAGIELIFENGQVVRASAAKNEALLLEMLEIDPGARYLGEFAIGTNYGIQRFTKSILYDEKIGGTIHMALGHGYPETGSKNVSGIHWDMICDMRNGGQIWVDDELVSQSGQFVS